MRSPINQLEELPVPTKQSVRHRLRRIERLTLRHAHRFLVRRVDNFRLGRRRAAGWVLLIASLVGVAVWQSGLNAQGYSAEIPSEHGVYSEGVYGALDNLNPILASSPAERAASRLLFAQLLMYDTNNDLVGELAQSWSSDDKGQVYTLRLKPTAKWQDGLPITADDVVFTFSLIKDADTRSPLYASWRNIVVEKIDANTVKFSLPTPYAAFPNSLTVGILPQHALKDTTASGLRSAKFNRAPTVVSGPFVYQDLRALDSGGMHYLLQTTANKQYVLGRPNLDGFQLNAYKDQEALVSAFKTQEVASFSDATSGQLNELQGVRYVQMNAPLFNGTYAFLNNESPALGDARVRLALQAATDQTAILKLLGGRVDSLPGPLLPEQFGYTSNLRQPQVDVARAGQLLDQAGWPMGPNGKRIKAGQSLRLHLVSISSGDFPAVTQEVMNQWGRLGIDFDSQLVRPEDAQQNVIVPRAYDVLIYEIAIGRDPDVYAYWASSQANSQGLNLSNYRSAKVDDELVSARTTVNTALRDAKYRAFFQQWLNDAPAVALYRPTLSYIQNANVVTFGERPLVDATDRYFNIRSWAVGRITGWPTR